FTAIHTQALSTQQSEAEKALFKLLFSSDPNNKAFDALNQSRLTGPSTEATLALMTYELEKGQIDNARTLRSEYELVAQLSEKHLLKWAYALEKSGQLQEALDSLDKIKSPSREARLLELTLLMKQEKFDAVETIFKTHKNTILQAADGVAILADLEQRRNHLTAAKQWLKRAISMSPYRAAYYVDLAKLLIATEDPDGALETCNEGLKLMPSSTAVLNLRGRIHYDMGNIHLAAKDWDESLTIDRLQFEIFARLMRAALETGDRNTAVTVFRAGKETLPDDPRWADLEKLLLRKKNP
ncbi:MAG: tetratricopeptide repeat protein, partial [Bradymonadia bacterium]